MHRTTIPVTAIRLLAVLALVLIVVQGTASGRLSPPEGTPTASPTPDGFIEVDGLEVAPVLPQEAEQGVSGLDPQNVALTRVTLEPGESLGATRAHWGSSVLFVERGTICYQVTNVNPATMSLVLISPQDLNDNPQPAATPEASPVATPDIAGGCGYPPPGCAEQADGCDLIALDLRRVVVHAGQSILQSAPPLDHVSRGYVNIGDETVVIWIAQLQTESGEIAPCGGGCP